MIFYLAMSGVRSTYGDLRSYYVDRQISSRDAELAAAVLRVMEHDSATLSVDVYTILNLPAFHVDRPQADQHEQLQQHQQETTKISESKTKPAKQRQQQQQQQASEEAGWRCSKGFEYSAELDSCYRLTGERTTWRMARQRCRQLDADLAVVDSARHQRYINIKARSNPDTRHCDLWIGLVRGRANGVEAGSSSSSSWHWVGDIGNARTPSYTNWNVNEPNNANSYEHCTQMVWIFSWRWNDAHCNYGNACYICQAKPAPPPRP